MLKNYAFLYNNGVMSNIGAIPGDTGSQGVSINAQGDVAGDSYDGNVSHAFLYSGGVMHNLGTLVVGDPSSQSQAFAGGINDKDQVVGAY